VPGQGGQPLTGTKTGKGRTVFVGLEAVGLLDRYWESKREMLGRNPDPEG
jgi:hypothetical protein